MSSGQIYRVLLKILGALHLFVGFGMLTFMLGTGPYRFGYLYVAGVIVVGLILIGRSLTPRFLMYPRGLSVGLAALLTLCVLGAASFFSGGAIGQWLEIRGMPNGLAYGFTPGAVTLGLVGTLVLPVLILLTARSVDAPLSVEEETRIPMKKSGSARTGLETVHLFFVRLIGLAALGTTAYGVINRAATQQEQITWGALGLLAALCFLVPRLTPRIVARPSRWFHFFGFSFLTSLLIYPPMMAYCIPVIETLQTSEATSLEVLGAEILEAFGSDGLIAYSAIGVPLQLAWFTMIGLLFQKPSVQVRSAPTASASHSADPGPAPRPTALPQAKLPAIGAMMKLYVVADWLVLRLMGLGLCATAWMLWTMIQQGETSQAELLAYGQDPMKALMIYGGFGAILALPFLLPGAIAAPRHVAGGLVKAVILVGAALVLIPPLRAAIVTFTPEIYHVTLMATVPTLFKAVTGVAVTSTLLIAFFRQLGTLPQTNYKGEPIVMLSQDDLRALRLARMQERAA